MNLPTTAKLATLRQWQLLNGKFIKKIYNFTQMHGGFKRRDSKKEKAKRKKKEFYREEK
ncbi:hypothetical protein HLVA_03950 [Haliovirga abyssi]|uniref:Uncharacterized protein n=1 Tax=Haliovirga abyssi TaxID=2996794 RepID=A0AAU9D1G7_9FUSO|nr:hypothetical protein HLVA_03950 [Haliovirga abyssi]